MTRSFRNREHALTALLSQKRPWEGPRRCQLSAEIEGASAKNGGHPTRGGCCPATDKDSGTTPVPGLSPARPCASRGPVYNQHLNSRLPGWLAGTGSIGVRLPPIAAAPVGLGPQPSPHAWVVRAKPIPCSIPCALQRISVFKGLPNQKKKRKTVHSGDPG